MNFIKSLITGGGDSEDLAVIPGGQFYLTRLPNSLKSANECIYKDAIATIRKTTIPFNYQLVVRRVYEEGEEDLDGDEDDISGLEDEEMDEKVFLLDEALELAYKSSSAGNVVITWKDTSGEDGDSFEFVCDDGIKEKVFDKFELVAKKCQYERKYGKSFSGPEDSLSEFDFTADEESKDEAQVSSPSAAPATPEKNKPVAGIAEADVPQTPVGQDSQTVAPKAAARPETGSVMTSEKCSLHLFDAASGAFVEQLSNSEAQILDLSKFEYWLEVLQNGNEPALGVAVSSDLNPCFNYEHLSFIFNYYSEEGAFSWLLKFENFESLERFQQGFMQAMWESTYKQSWAKASANDQEYLTEAFGDLGVEESPAEEDAYETADEDEELVDAEPEFSQKEDFDEDEEHDTKEEFSGNGKNSQLAVGTLNDRSYVVRGDKIGVFKQTDENDLEFSTTINDISDSKGNLFAPKKVMLYNQERDLVMQNPEDLNKLFKLDLEYGKVVEQWKMDDSTNVQAYAPDSKFSQRTGEQTFIGVSDNGLFRVDPRLAGNKIVDNEKKTYSTKRGFSALGTTESGHVAVASSKGDIQLYDRLGVRAKTHLPALGDAILGIDVSADGKWLLATCKTYLLLVDTTIKEGQYSGSTGFQRSFAKDTKPRPKRLQISPEHVAFMQAEVKKPLSFTKAYFNSGINAKEHMIVTSSGPYVVTWSLNKILRGDREPYLIKRYSSNVTADNFAFGTDKNVIISLEDDVGMVNRRTFRKPTRQSLATPAKRVQALSRNSIVNSPY